MSQAWYITVHIASRRRLEILNKYWNSHYKHTGPISLCSLMDSVFAIAQLGDNNTELAEMASDARFRRWWFEDKNLLQDTSSGRKGELLHHEPSGDYTTSHMYIQRITLKLKPRQTTGFIVWLLCISKDGLSVEGLFRHPDIQLSPVLV